MMWATRSIPRYSRALKGFDGGGQVGGFLGPNVRIPLGIEASSTQMQKTRKMSASLDVFTLPASDVSIQGYRMNTYEPVSSGIIPMEFKIGGLEEYVDLSRSYLKLRVKLETGATNSGIYGDAKTTAQSSNRSGADYSKYMYPVNNFGHTIIRQANLRFNGTLLSPQTDAYAYKAYLELLLNYTPAEGETLLAPQGWVNYVNVMSQIESTAVDDDIPTTATAGVFASGTNNKLKELGGKFVAANEVDLVIRPHLEALYTGRILVPGIEIILQLYFNSPDFFMFGTKATGKKYVTLQPESIDAKFYMCRLALNPTVYTNLELKCKQTKIVAYPTVRTDVRTFTFDGKTTRFEERDIFQNRVPDRMVVGFVHSEAYNGALDYYPFAFQKFGVTRIRQIVRGEEYPYETLELNQSDSLKDWAGYFRFLQATGPLVKSSDCMVKPGDWGDGNNCTLFAWNNVPSSNAGMALMNPRQARNVKLEITFGAAPNKNITVLVWGEFENVIEIDDNGAVQYNIHDV